MAKPALLQISNMEIKPAVRGILAEWKEEDPAQVRALTIYILFALNDRTVASTSCEWLFPHLRRSPSELRIGDLETYLRRLGEGAHPEIAEWTPKTLTRVAQHYLASIRDFGLATGSVKKVSINIEFIPNFGERYRQGETISTAFVESTINQVVSKRFVKKQQMQWTPQGAHFLLQTRTKVLNNDLEDVFRGWYPQFHARAA